MSRKFLIGAGALCLLIGLFALGGGWADRRTPDGKDLAVAGAVFAVLGILLFAFASGKPPRRTCPYCSGVRHSRAARAEAKDYRGLFGFGPFFPVFKCHDCGRVWQPPVPRAVLLGGVGTGVLCLLLGVLTLAGASGDFALVCGVLLTAYGLAATVGCAKRMAKTPSESGWRDHP